MATYLPNGRQQFFNPNTGAPLAGGFVWHYVPGTSTLKDTWQQLEATALNTNPVVLDADGTAAIWGKGIYRQLLLDSDGNTLWDQVTTSGISDVMDPVVSASSLSGALTALGVSPAWQPVVGASTLSSGMVNMGISLAMQPVVGAATLALARDALGVSAVGLEVYNVKAYGAVGDGVTNDTAAIQACMAACTAGIVYFPSGSYLVTSTIFVKPGVSIWGNSMLTSTLLAGVNSLNLFAFIAPSLSTGFEFFNIGLSGNGFSNCGGVVLDGVDGTKRISIVHFQNVYLALLDNGIYLKFCANIVLDNVFCNVCDSGIWLDNAADAVVSNSKAQNGLGYGFYVSGGPGAYDEGVRLVNCSTNGQAYGVGVVGQDWGQIVACSFTTCSVLPGAFVGSNNWRINATDFAAAAGVDGLSIDATCANIQVSECFFALNNNGIVLRGTRCAIRGCNFVSNTGVDIQLIDATVNSIIGNTCDSVSLPQSILESGTANYSALTGNCVAGTVVVVGAQSVQVGTVSY